mgnify:CR=1 FL=1
MLIALKLYKLNFQTDIVKLMINDQGVYSQDGFIIVGIHYLGSEINYLCVLKLFIDVLLLKEKIYFFLNFRILIVSNFRKFTVKSLFGVSVVS